MLRELFATLAPFKPLLAGTYPLGIHTDSSGVVVICEARDLAAFEAAVRASYADAPGFAIRQVAGKPPALIASFTVDGLAVEVSGQALPTYDQQAFRNLLVEARLLRVANAALRDGVMVHMRAGTDTERAFAAAVGLRGDPNEAILKLESASDAELGQLVLKAGFGLRGSPTASDAPTAGLDWNKIFTEAIPNPRMAQDELERQLEELSAELSMHEKIDIAKRLRMRVENLRLTNPVTEFGIPEAMLSLYRWCNGGEFAVGERRFVPILRLHEIRHYLVEYAIPHFMASCIPVALDGKGNCYFVDLSTKPNPWITFGPLDRLGSRDKFRVLVDNFEGIFLDSSDPSEW